MNYWKKKQNEVWNNEEIDIFNIRYFDNCISKFSFNVLLFKEDYISYVSQEFNIPEYYCWQYNFKQISLKNEGKNNVLWNDTWNLKLNKISFIKYSENQFKTKFYAYCLHYQKRMRYINMKEEHSLSNDNFKYLFDWSEDTILEETSIINDELFNKGVMYVLNNDKASASYLQRVMSITYNQASEIIDSMEAIGMIGSSAGANPRKIYLTHSDWQDICDAKKKNHEESSSNVKDIYAKKELYELSDRIKSKLSEHDDIDDTLCMVDDAIDKLICDRIENNVNNTKDLVEIVNSYRIDSEYQGKELMLNNDYWEIFNLIDNWNENTLTLITGKNDCGKTCLILNMILDLTLRENLNILMITNKNGSLEIINKMISIESELDFKNLNELGSEDISAEEFTVLSKSSEIANSNLFIDDECNIRLMGLKSKIMNYYKSHKIDIVFIDKSDSLIADDVPLCIDDYILITKTLKELVSMLGVSIVALSNLEELGELAYRRPISYVDGLIRMQRTKDLCELDLVYNKRGGLGKVLLDFNHSQLRFKKIDN